MTVTSREPRGVFRGIVTSTANCVGLRTVTGPKFNPLPKLTVVTPLMKSDPLKVSVRVFPLPPTTGETAVTAGVGFNTVNAPESVTGPFPPEFETHTSLGPDAAVYGIVMRTLIWEILNTVTESIEIPLPMPTTVTPAKKFEPVRRTVALRPRTPSPKTPVRVGTGTTLNPDAIDAVPPPGAALVTVTVRAPSAAPAPMDN